MAIFFSKQDYKTCYKKTTYISSVSYWLSHIKGNFKKGIFQDKCHKLPNTSLISKGNWNKQKPAPHARSQSPNLSNCSQLWQPPWSIPRPSLLFDWGENIKQRFFFIENIIMICSVWIRRSDYSLTYHSNVLMILFFGEWQRLADFVT